MPAVVEREGVPLVSEKVGAGAPVGIDWADQVSVEALRSLALWETRAMLWPSEATV
jgi:hypothetical protein